MRTPTRARYLVGGVVAELLGACDGATVVSPDPATDAAIGGAPAGGSAEAGVGGQVTGGAGGDVGVAGFPDAPRPPTPDAGDARVDARPVADLLPRDDAASLQPDTSIDFVDSGQRCPDGLPPRAFHPDADGDGYGDVIDLVVGCEGPPGYVANDRDCDDRRVDANPGASESCNQLDDDCDGEVDNDAADEHVYYADADADGQGDPMSAPAYGCVPSPGFAANIDDCNDADAAIGDCAAPAFCSANRRCLSPGQCDAGPDCPRGMVCGAAGVCEPGSPCGGESYACERVQPNLLIVLDRSCSMRTRVDGVRKWQAAVDAIIALTRQYTDQIRFGLTLFPDQTGGQCRQDAIPVPIADGAEAQIEQLLTAALDDGDALWPDGPCVTNIDTAMLQASTEPRLNDPAERGFVMLVSDGAQAGCNVGGGDAGTTQIITELQARGVSTFVVGFGGAEDAAQLDIFAQAGGVPHAGDPAYYRAADAAALLAALQGIGEQVVSCEFVLAEAPPNPFELHVFFDRQEEVPRDVAHQNGWDYDEATLTVTFYGPACDRLTQRAVEDVDVVFGCDYSP